MPMLCYNGQYEDCIWDYTWNYYFDVARYCSRARSFYYGAQERRQSQ